MPKPENDIDFSGFEEEPKLTPEEVLDALLLFNHGELFDVMNRMSEWLPDNMLDELVIHLELRGYTVVKMDTDGLPTRALIEDFLEKLKADPYAKTITANS